MDGPEFEHGQAEVNRRVLALDARAAGLRRMPYLGDGETAQGVNLVEEYSRLTAVAVAKARFYGELLAEQHDHERLQALRRPTERAGGDSDGSAEGDGPGSPIAGGPVETRGLIGFTGTALAVGPVAEQRVEFVATGEARRELVRLEFEERREAARLIESAHKMGVELDQVEALRTYAGAVTSTLEAVIGELGLDIRWEPVLRAARRAGMVARRVLGQDDGSPDQIGPRMSAGERVEVLELALAQARREASVEQDAVAGVIEGDLGGPPGGDGDGPPALG